MIKKNFGFILNLSLSLVLSLILNLTLNLNSAFAYPELIRLSYIQCSSCHTNSSGGGLLSPYGKSVRTSLSLYQREAEQKSESNSIKPNVDLNANAFLRYLFIESENFRTSFLMQLDAEGRAELKNNTALTSIVGLTPERVKNRVNAPSGILGKSFILRRFLLEKGFNEGSKKILIGRDILPRGTNTEDHTTYLRTFNRAGVTDTPTQLRYETSTETLSTSSGVFAPSFEENSNAREWGLFSRAEWDAGKRIGINMPFSVGSQFILGKTKDFKRVAPELFARIAITDKIGSLIDFQYVHRNQNETSKSFNQTVLFFSPFYIPTEWSMIRYKAEKINRQSPYPENAFKHSLSLLLKPISELTFISSIERERAAQWGETLYTVQIFSQL